jgi:large subunit ribosomal protein L18
MTAKVLKLKNAARVKRKRRIRAKISGCASKPRVSIFRSNRYVSAQAIDDAASVTLASINSKALGLSANIDSATKTGEAFAAKLKEAGITEIYFDRNGYEYHGVVKAFAEALRNNEIKF